MSALEKITESQFYTVWTEAVGRNGYDKKMFQETLIALKEKGLIIESNFETSVGIKQPDTEANDNKHVVTSRFSGKQVGTIIFRPDSEEIEVKPGN